MASPMPPCDPDRLRLLLDDRLPDNEQEDLSRHLETCASCRDALERMAAETHWWSDVKDLGGPDHLGASPEEGHGDFALLTDLDNDSSLTIPKGFLAPSDHPDSIGKIALYEVSAVIGRGGNGLVLKALDPALNRHVAVKVLAPNLATNAAARRRFAREARAAAAVTHENVVAIHAVDAAPNGLPYLVMSYVPGKSLQERLDREGPLEVKEILRIGMQTASGLAAAHAQGLVHRDIKPANILLENGVERVKITDFGLARTADDASLSQSGLVAGTPQYMAPEQARGETVDHRSDLFSLGSVLYAMATGRSPFRADSAMAVLRRVSDDAPRPVREINPEIPDWLAQIINRLLEKDPVRRFQSAEEVADVLSRALAFVQNPGGKRPPYEGASSISIPLHGRWPLVAAVLVVMVMGLGAAEATGVSHVGEYVATVLRIKTADGTLVLTVDDSAVQVEIDGEYVNLKGLGPQTVRLHAGEHRVLASKSGVPIKDELIQIVRGEKHIVTVGVEPIAQGSAPDETGRNPRAVESKSPAEERPGLDPQEVARREAAFVEEIAGLRAQNRRLQNKQNESDRPTTQSSLSPVAPSLVLSVPNVERYWSVAFLPDEKTLVAGFSIPTPGVEDVGTGQGGLVLWDLAKQTYRVIQLSHPIRSIAVSPDGTMLATAELGHPAILRDAKSGDPIRTLDSTAKGTNAVVFTPDGQNVITAGLDGVITLARVDTGAAIRRYEMPMEPVADEVESTAAAYSVAVSPNGRLLASGGKDEAAYIWDVATGTLIHTFDGHDGPIERVAFSPDGKSLVTASWDMTIRVWDISRGRERTLLGHRLPVVDVAFSPDGKRFATCATVWGTESALPGEGELALWDAETKKSLTPVMDYSDRILGIAFSRNSESLATAAWDGAIRIWDVKALIKGKALLPTVNPLSFAPLGINEPLGDRLKGAGQPRLESPRRARVP